MLLIAGIGLFWSLSAIGCVTYVIEPEDPEVDPSLATAVTIPLHGDAADANQIAVTEYHQNVVAQLQDALADRDLPLLESLLEQHDRGNSPEWFRELLDGYRRRAAALAFELHAAAVAEIRALNAEAAVGEILAFELVIPSATRSDLVVPGADGEAAAARFRFTVAVFDIDCFGNRTERRSADLVTLEHTAAIGVGEPLSQPFGVPALSASGCLRRVAIEVDWMPGNLELADGPAPHGRTRIAQGEFEYYPRGIESLRENPYTNLRNALESGDPRYFNNLFLTSRFLPEEYREDAISKLIRGVRVGRPDVVRVCTATLAELTGESFSLGDRDAWLEWWSRRTSSR